ncbi:MAG TPA: hypothetical protein VGB89_02965 [Bacteroidota bacterium]|jgi:YbbR domain-containing protein
MKTKRLHIVIITVVFAIILWLSVKLGSTYQVNVSASVVIENVPPGMAIATPVPRTLQLRFRGEGWQLVPLLFGTAPDYRIDARDLGTGSKTITMDNISSTFSSGGVFLLVGMNPDTVFVKLEHFAAKSIPVKSDLKVVFRDGYGQVGRTVIEPESVTVGGAASIIASLDQWHTVRKTLDNIQAPMNQLVALADTGVFRVTLNPQAVRVRMDVQSLAEKTISGLLVEVYDVPNGLEVIVIPPKIDLLVRSGIRRLSNISSESFRVSAMYSEILADSSGTFIPDLDGPNDVQIIGKRPDRLQYIVRKRL